MVSTISPQPTRAKLIRINNVHATICWKRERQALSALAPSRRDLLSRLLRNALPLGFKRIHWTIEAQTKCMLCEDETLETADHIFWRCKFAKEIWNNVVTPWRNHQYNAIGWREVLIGYEVRLGPHAGTEVERLWAMVRACIIRTIWFERNRRYFYASLPNRTAQYRQNQGMDDIKMHVESWLRRANDKEHPLAIAAVKFMMSRSPAYNMIVTSHPRTSGHTINSV